MIESESLGGLNMMHTMNMSKYVVKNGPISNLQSTLNDLDEQGYSFMSLHQFLTADGLKFSLVMCR